ncbi:MAG: 5-formyltetrahydrofolate cyclo-ligase [Mycoplasma sp.]
MSISKDEIRKEKLDLRKRMYVTAVEKLSYQICERLIISEIITPNSRIGIYKPITNEVNVQHLAQWLKEENKSVLYTPRVLDHGDMIFEKVFKPISSLDLKYTDPLSGMVDGIEYFIIPLVAFDRKMNRIGFGKGYYDRYLNRYEKNCIKIGLAYSFQETIDIPSEPHDVKLDYIVTEKEIIKFLELQ